MDPLRENLRDKETRFLELVPCAAASRKSKLYQELWGRQRPYCRELR